MFERLVRYKDIKTIKFCAKCDHEFRGDRFYKIQGMKGSVCSDCFKKKFRPYIRKYMRRYRWAMTPEEKKKYYEQWLAWVAKHKKRRREIALKSYHKRKRFKARASAR